MRVRQSDRLVQGPAGLGRRLGRPRAVRRPGDCIELLRQCRRGGGRLCGTRGPALYRLHLPRHRRADGDADAGLRRHGRRRRGQGASLDAARSGRAPVRLVPDLALLRPGRRQQPLRHRRLQVARLRNRGAARVARARLDRPAGLLRRRAGRHGARLCRTPSPELDQAHAAAGGGGNLRLAVAGRAGAARRPAVHSAHLRHGRRSRSARSRAHSRR